MTILVVDDDEVLGRILARVLARQGHEVVVAADADQAQQLAREHRPRLALIDLCLPGADGIELARRLRAAYGELVMILMTAYPLRLRERPELAADFARVLIKPVDLKDLREAVETSLAPCKAHMTNSE